MRYTSFLFLSWTLLAGLLLAALSFTLAACGEDQVPPPVRNFDRPTEITFACFGDLKVNGTSITSAQPLSSCAAHARGEVPEGQEGIVAPSLFGLVLQPDQGTVAVVNVTALGVQDNDQLTPGLNDIPVGSIPVGMAEDRSGCFVITANSGSCDLATIDATSALDLTRLARVNRVAITTPAGQPLLSRPRSLASGPQSEEIGNACPLAAEGLVYISYPDCHLVAAVEAATGVIQSGLAFRDDGTVEVASDADYAACPVQCGDGVINVARGTGLDAPEERPATLEISSDGTMLYVASESSPFFTMVDLDVGGLPTTNQRIRVDDDAFGDFVGLKSFAISDRIDMGGDKRNPIAMPIGEFRFAYVVATDNTIRVIDLEHMQECDTQVDPRYLALETDVEFLSCMPVGDLRTPPRRAGAISPGIHIPGRMARGRIGLASLAVPLDIAFATAPVPEATTDSVGPNSMMGSFAFVSTAAGDVVVVNVDDDGYPDTEDPTEPLAATLPLALAHQIRDDIDNREKPSENCSSPATSQAGARLIGAPSQIVDVTQIAANRLHELPFFRGLECSGEDSLGNKIDTVVSELSFAADLETREVSYPDLRLVDDQQWSIAWEGAHAADGRSDNIDGPPIRKAVVVRDGAKTLLQDAGAPFCSVGVEPFDILALVGCNPLLDDTQCGVGETCQVHPDTTAAVRTGVCLPEQRVDELSATCREFMTSRRRYSVASSSADELELIPRNRMLRTSPLDGCESAVQCEELAALEPLLAMDGHPIDTVVPDPEREFTWACEADPSRRPGVDRCLMTCETIEDCEDGFSCVGQHCVEAPLPPSSCLLAVQRYQSLVGEAFAVVGADDGYISSLIADPGTGECIRPASANVLQVSRIPLRPEPCDDDGDFFTGPNPCSTMVEHAESYVPYVVEDNHCVPRDVTQRTRQANAIRFSNPSMSFHLVDTETQGDLQCLGDQAGEGPAIGTPFAGYQMRFEVGGGFVPKRVPEFAAALPSRVEVSPLGNLWVLDQGDSSTINRGRLFRLNPLEPGDFDLTVFQ